MKRISSNNHIISNNQIEISRQFSNNGVDLEQQQEQQQRPRRQSRRSLRLLQSLSLAAFLVFWVANGEILQGISNGVLTPGNVPYDKPVFVTWFGYNFMMLGGLVFVLPYHGYCYCSSLYSSLPRRQRQRQQQPGFRVLLWHTWPGKLGFVKACASCVFIAYMLQVLNVLMIVGLECIPVSLSNAIYQLQTAFTIGLSVFLLHDRFVFSQGLGILVSILGVSLMVLPPLFQESQPSSLSSSCLSSSYPMLLGTLATLGSAAIGGAYLVAWRVLEEQRRPRRLDDIAEDEATTNRSQNDSRWEGFMDTQMTLAMIGFCNFVFGWPVLVLADWVGLEPFQWPDSSTLWWILQGNGLVEYAFDASCAVAISMTSPVVVAVVSPLTIPLSIVADQWIYSDAVDGNSHHPWASWLGSFVILSGIAILESKPDLKTVLSRISVLSGARKFRTEKKEDSEIVEDLLASCT